ncbi:citrate/2-methylcitrate synthase [Streptomyces sp. HSW2009]|uniref:citrate/2-methylcitrate synthase n=1 Tax=Streptomyces sp. HSW2009 TaxID=3142890 RepID=UPI0032F012BF
MADTEADPEATNGADARRLTTREAAELLGVKPETVYAYVSRGQLTSHRTPGERGSTFDAHEVAALARRGRRDSPAQPAAQPAPGGTLVRTGITLITPDRHHYRGVDATELAQRYSYEEVAEWLWTGRLRPGRRFTAPPETRAAARRAVAALPPHSGPMDGLRVAAIAAAAADPLRFDLSPQTVLASARSLIATLVDALPYAPGQQPPPYATGSDAAPAGTGPDRPTPPATGAQPPSPTAATAGTGPSPAPGRPGAEANRLPGDLTRPTPIPAPALASDRPTAPPPAPHPNQPPHPAGPDTPAAPPTAPRTPLSAPRPTTHPDDDGATTTHQAPSIAEQLWLRLSPHRPTPASLRALQTALVLLIDHDLAASTLAVRVAASARAHPYAAVSAGLGAADGPLHGAASGLAHRMLTEALERGSAAVVVADQLRAGGRVPGLGHPLYPAHDPRARTLFALLAEVPEAAAALAAAREVEATAARHTELHANVDLALAVLTVSAGMPSEAGETVFALARVAGWIAHALEEYAESPLRMRPSGHYTGPRPPQPLP